MNDPSDHAPVGGRPTSRYDLGRRELAELLDGQPGYRLDQLWQGLYRDLADPDRITTLPAELRRELAEVLPAALSLDTRSEGDDGQTVKWLWKLAGAALV